MSIAFEQVSYSYDAPKPQRTRKGLFTGDEAHAGGETCVGDEARVGGETAAVAKPETSATGEHSWGNVPENPWALHEVSFTLEDGEFLGIAGHTGSGKSTLIQHMNGLLHPTSGRVLVDGADLADKTNATAARTKVGLVFQYPENQLFAATVYEDVVFGPRNMGLNEAEVRDRVNEALGAVGLDAQEIGNKSPFELSGGQQRRVAFAGVLAMKPSTLVLDEPAAGLDPRAHADFLELIAHFHAAGTTVCMVSHNMDDLARYADRVLVLDGGRVFALGSPEEVFARAKELHGIGLGVPAAQSMALSLKAAGVTLNHALYTDDELADDIAVLFYEKTSAGPKQKEKGEDGVADSVSDSTVDAASFASDGEPRVC